MPDASDPRGRAPADWSDAFASMPQETPPRDGWTRVANALDARAASDVVPVPVAVRAGWRRRGARRAAAWLGAATAAALALVVAWPRNDAPAVFPKPRDALVPAAAVATAAADPRPAATPAATDAGPAAATTTATARRDVAPEATPIALPKAVEKARKPRYARRDAPAPATPGNAAATGNEALDALYAESARLEALLALARDDRVASAGAALLAAELEARVAGIDARLGQPGLDDAQRTALWRARVDALRQAAGFESTRRLLASRGDGGALLVSVD